MISQLKTNYSVTKYEMVCNKILRARFSANQCNENAGEKEPKSSTHRLVQY